MAWGRKKDKDIDTPSSELPKEYKSMLNIFNKVYNSEEYKDRRKDMNRWLELYEAKLWGKDLDDSESRVQVNYIFSSVEAICPLLTDNRPIWHTKAKEPVFQNLSNLYGKASEYLWDFLEMDDIIHLVVKDCLLFPVGLTETYWDVEADEIGIEVTDPRTFVIAPGYDDLWKAAWCGTKTRKALSWAKMNYPEKYKYIKSDNEKNPDERENKTFMELEDETFIVYKIWMRDDSIVEYMETEQAEYDESGNIVEEEKKVKKYKQKYPNGRTIILTKDIVLSDEDSPFKHGLPPWVAWYDYRVPHSFWGMGEPQQIEYLHKEYNTQLQTAVKWTRLTENPNYTIDTAAGLDEETVKDEFWEGGKMWIVNPTEGDPIKKVEPGIMDRTALELIRILPKAIEETSGLTAPIKGQAAKKERQSATEWSGIMESGYTRTRQKVRNLESSLKRQNYLHISLMQQYYDTPRYFSYKTGDEEGARLDFGLIGNSADVFRQVNKPEQIQLDDGGMEGQDDYNQRIKEDKTYQETERLINEVFGKTDPIHFKFKIEIQTNSTLPMDKQSLANLFLRLAEIQTSPNSIVDAEAVMEQLQVPNREAIQNRKEQEKKRILQARQQQAQVPGKGPKSIPMGGAPPGVPQLVRGE
ncbi:hypothetical protein LCGC14_0926750 [marine sediment metagenome]|uniref:Portal protein n=1 Tax=marine sediment metagenome TaxID=412755 RepID=A0A0F9PA27_9ZZZZ